MNTKDKINKISGLCSTIISLSNFYNNDEFKFYFAYDRVIEMLENTIVEIEASLRCKRPENLPEDIPWSESTNPEWVFDPYVYDGTMTIEDFEKAQAATLKDLEKGF